jgi:hypothetical protein
LRRVVAWLGGLSAGAVACLAGVGACLAGRGLFGRSVACSVLARAGFARPRGARSARGGVRGRWFCADAMSRVGRSGRNWALWVRPRVGAASPPVQRASRAIATRSGLRPSTATRGRPCPVTPHARASPAKRRGALRHPASALRPALSPPPFTRRGGLLGSQIGLLGRRAAACSHVRRASPAAHGSCRCAVAHVSRGASRSVSDMRGARETSVMAQKRRSRRKRAHEGAVAGGRYAPARAAGFARYRHRHPQQTSPATARATGFAQHRRLRRPSPSTPPAAGFAR